MFFGGVGGGDLMLDIWNGIRSGVRGGVAVLLLKFQSWTTGGGEDGEIRRISPTSKGILLVVNLSAHTGTT